MAGFSLLGAASAAPAARVRSPIGPSLEMEASSMIQAARAPSRLATALFGTQFSRSGHY